ncbi:hypothetical protein ACQEVY_22750 [Streptomyces sp. CA-288835]|uniref:hypothetical protein n=1 Tax=Streptomyces sp. CA-288835 TaxID=3240069 RepID=UPI003D92176D
MGAAGEPALPRRTAGLGIRNGVEVGIACSTYESGEGETHWYTSVLVRLPEERPPTRLRHREIRRLGLPRGAESVEMGGRELRMGYDGWPESSLTLNAQVDAAVRVAASLRDTVAEEPEDAPGRGTVSDPHPHVPADEESS